MLPPVETDEEWDTVVPDATVMRPGAEDLATAGDGIAEGPVLSHVEGRLPVPTPRVHEAGPYEKGRRYVLTSRLRGENLAGVRDRVPQADRERLVCEIGEALGVLHGLDAAPLGDVLGPGVWGAFVDRRRDGAVEGQRGRGLSADWLEQIPAFLASVPLPRTEQRSLPHTEVMRRRFLVDPDGRRLTGLVDFEPAMIGDRAYDFVGVGPFVTRGDPRLPARLSQSYGTAFAPAVLLAYTLLHEFSDLARYLRELGAPADGTLPSPADAWFGTA
ncbi:aminoglycoside phosphotransferase family protein [Streptomyces sp. NPDC006385]|uniref:aminoglycoside phosphotransferase family protein n=1 Tax=Streptomyces sp. NPDC006385 TaxID=3156761 RepID=UPI0033A083F6